MPTAAVSRDFEGKSRSYLECHDGGLGSAGFKSRVSCVILGKLRYTEFKVK